MTCLSPAACRLLAVEDDPLLAYYLNAHFVARGFAVSVQGTAVGFMEQATQPDISLVLLDILLPGGNGLALLSELRGRCGVPVILTSALGAEQDRISGFSRGADDYLPKPFSMQELDARVDAVLRRVAYERASQARLTEDAGTPEMPTALRAAGLTPVEQRLFDVLHGHAGDVLSKPFLYQQVLHRPYARQDRVLDLHISHLRRKLVAARWPGQLNTAWGQGYVLVKA